MKRSFHLAFTQMILIGLVACAIPARASLLMPGEVLGTQFVNATMGTQGAGSAALSETGFEKHGAFGIPADSIGPRRFYDGDAGGTQAAGTAEIAWKNAGGETISDVFDSAGPTTATTYYGGGNFDGTSLWLSHSIYNDGGAPPTGTTDPGTDPAIVAGSGTDLHLPDAEMILVTPVDGQVDTYSYLQRLQVYVPSHAASKQVFLGYYADRSGFGLYTPGGQGLAKMTLPFDQWNLVEVRLDLTVDGGAPGSEQSDDVLTADMTFEINGAAAGTLDKVFGAGSQMQLRSGDIRFSPGFGLQRGWQGAVPEAYLDSIELYAIVPEPATLSLLSLGALAVLRRRG